MDTFVLPFLYLLAQLSVDILNNSIITHLYVIATEERVYSMTKDVKKWAYYQRMFCCYHVPFVEYQMTY